jgi:anti-repressor protein
MNELIKIMEQDGKRAVSARELHTFLESKQDFSNWIKNRIEKYGFIEGEDYEVFNKFIENLSGGRPQIEYALSIDCAKELSMVGVAGRRAVIKQNKVQ